LTVASAIYKDMGLLRKFGEKMKGNNSKLVITEATFGFVSFAYRLVFFDVHF